MVSLPTTAPISLSPMSFLSHVVACLHWPLLSLSDMILSFNIFVFRDSFFLDKVDLSMVVLTEENHSHVISSRLMTIMIISVPQRFKVDFFACVGPALDVQKEVPILAVHDC